MMLNNYIYISKHVFIMMLAHEGIKQPNLWIEWLKDTTAQLEPSNTLNFYLHCPVLIVMNL